MNSLTDQANIVNTHLSFIDTLGKRLRDRPYALSDDASAPIVAKLLGLQSLISSLVCASPTPRLVRKRDTEDWNPLSQRILLSHESPLPASLLEEDFSLVPTYVQTFIEWAHESVHILALEPWFCGSKAIQSEHVFKQWYRAGEATAYWYADIVVTRTVRDTVPEADLIYTRCSVSNTGFHPEQAFQTLGFTSNDDILPLYVMGFLGEHTALQQSDNPMCKTLCQRIGDMYTDTAPSLQSLYAMHHGADLLEGFYQRYCQIENIPTLFDASQLERIVTLDIAEYHILLGRELLPSLQTLPSERIRRVAVRRHLQTRAYYSWILNVALQRGDAFGDPTFAPEKIIVKLERYLNDLEYLLGVLASGQEVDETLRALKACDQRYEFEVRGPLRQSHAHMKYRYFIFPFFSATGGLVGIADQRTDFSMDEMAAVARFVFDRTTWDIELVQCLNVFLQAHKEGDENGTRAAFNTFISHPNAISTWSIKLGDLSPAYNRFRECLVEYH